MTQSQYSLIWDEHKKNICTGLSSLQQNGEFVDMTLAADGHFVKVHQVIIALTSPYIKDLIKAANCPHPVIFLNKISYGTLCSILEYIYTGEVLVSINSLDEFIEAGRELHIRGLEDMKPHHNLLGTQQLSYQQTQCATIEDLDEEVCYIEVTAQKNHEPLDLNYENSVNDSVKSRTEVEDTFDDDIAEDSSNYEVVPMEDDNAQVNTEKALKTIDTKNVRVMQYTVSNQGSLQMILNRFLYYLKHTNRNNARQWRCVDYLGSLKCPAHVVTQDDIVVQRVNAHTHPFHDKKIMKKVKAGAIFTAIQEAEMEGTNKRQKTDSLES